MGKKAKKLRNTNKGGAPPNDEDCVGELSIYDGPSLGEGHATDDVDLEINDTNETGCRHLRGIRVKEVRIALSKNSEVAVCQACNSATNDGSVKKGKKKAVRSNTRVDSTEPTWVCLTCGHIGCGRETPEKHALGHADSHAKHSIAMSTQNLSCWCYQCDEDVDALVQKLSPATREKVQLALEQCRAVIGKVLKGQGKQSKQLSEDADTSIAKPTGVNAFLLHDNAMLTAEKVSTDAAGSSLKVPDGVVIHPKGLKNLGNTCFFNAVLQNLNVTSSLASSFGSTRQNEGPTTVALREFYANMHDAAPGKASGSYNPQKLFTQVVRRVPRFRGYQQQDAHELLRFLLDGVQTEENDRLKRESANTDTGEKKPSMIEEVFQGYLCSTVVCQNCKTISRVCDPYLDLSLEIPAAVELGRAVYSSSPLPTGRRRKKEKERLRSAQKTAAVAITGTSFTPTVTKPAIGNKKARLLAAKQQKAQKKAQKRERQRDAAKGVSHHTETTESGEEEGTDHNKQEHDQHKHAESITEEDVNTTNDIELKTINSQPDSQVDLKIDSEGDSCPSDPLGSSLSHIEEAMSNIVIHEPSSTVDSQVIHASGPNEEEAVQPSISCLDSAADPEHELSDDESEDEDDAGDAEYDEGRPDAQTENIPYFDRRIAQLAEPAPPSTLSGDGCSLLSCLSAFTMPESLDQPDNLYGCLACTRRAENKNNKQPNQSTKRTDGNSSSSEEDEGSVSTPLVRCPATRRFLIYRPPKVLTLHLKRFVQTMGGVKKFDRHIDFPLELDLEPYCLRSVPLESRVSSSQCMKYVLYGVVVHSGGLSGGHYTAYTRTNRSSNRWCYFSDTHCSYVNQEEVLSSQAYLLFYEQVDSSSVST
eukprot:GILK01009217.1.p1 GENE.GILK01009217.1~~GILK01009217.1.p1  ORF type:complete len:896 (-),score=132.96 GILK01009217.1:88-2703(-)